MFKRIIGFILALGGLLTVGNITTAQQAAINGPIANLNGDLWAYNIATGQATQLTQWGYNGEPVISPDSSKIAYVSWAEEFVNNGQANTYPGTAPGNIWILNRADGSFQRIAEQNGSSILRSSPAWSPDSNQLAWSELEWQPNGGTIGGSRLVTHDLRTGATSILNNDYDLGFQDGGIYMPPVKWGEGGIMRTVTTFVDESNPGLGEPMRQLLELYVPSNGTLRTFDLGSHSMQTNNDFAIEAMWALENNTPVLVLFWREAGWERLDPVTGVRSPLETTPHLSIKFGVGTITLVPLYQPNRDGWSWNWQAEVLYDGGVPGYTTMIGYNANTLQDWALPSVSGSYEITWADYEGNVYLWQDGAQQNPRVIMSSDRDRLFGIGPISTAWAGMQWYIDSSRTISPTQPPVTANCTMPPRITVGDYVTVTPGVPNNVRPQPANGSAIAQFANGQIAQVIEGPVCADGMYWWRVSNARFSGWTAEGDNGEYWLTRTSTAPTATPVVVSACNNPPPRLRPGQDVVVSPGLPNNWRAQPGTKSEVLGVFPAGTRLTVLQGPVCSEGMNWYQIQFTEGQGWTAEGASGIYWLNPIN